MWKAKDNEAFAKHRMSDRAKDGAEKLAVELRQPQAQSSLPRPVNWCGKAAPARRTM